MRSKIPLKWWLLLVCVAETMLALVVIFFIITDLKDQGFDAGSFFSPGKQQERAPVNPEPVKPDEVEYNPNTFPAVEPDLNPVVIPIAVPKQIIPVDVQIVPGPVVAIEGLARIEIAVLGVDAVIESVGLTPEGAMGVPKGPNEVAWFSLGPRPGEIGSAVMAGHSGWKDGLPAVFDDLHKLQKGDKVLVKNGDGPTFVFVVRESRLYNPNADATDVFTSSDGKAHLNLVTCEGVWNTITKSRSSRLVVFTDKE